MIDLLRASESVLDYHVRTWTGIATDEGVGLIATVEVSDGRGVPVCRFEEFLDATLQQTKNWPRDNVEASRLLQDKAMERARGAVLGNCLHDVHGHRFDITA